MRVLLSTVPGCTWLYLVVPGSALVCHDLSFHRMPHTATDWPKCFCIYRLKCSKAVSGWAVENLRDTLFNIIMIIIIIVIKFKLCRRSVFWIHPEILLCPVVIHLQIFVKVLHHRVRKVDIFRAEPRDRRRWRDSCFVAS